MTFDPSTYVSTRVHGGVRELTEEEAKPIRERARNYLLKRSNKVESPSAPADSGVVAEKTSG